MQMNKKQWLILAAVLVLGAIVYFVLQRRKKGQSLNIGDILTGSDTANTGQVQMDVTLKQGMKGVEVSELQKRLKRDGGAGFLGDSGPNGDGVDGDFGPLTLAALREVMGVDEITLNEYDAAIEMAKNRPDTYDANSVKQTWS